MRIICVRCSRSWKGKRDRASEFAGAGPHTGNKDLAGGGAGCKIRRAILDQGVTIPDGQRIGYDVGGDRRKHHVSESGIVVYSRRIES